MDLAACFPLVFAAAPAEPSIFDGSNTFVTWAVQFLVTLAIELPMVLIAWRFRGCPGPLRPWLLAALVGNLVSHPIATALGTALGLPGRGMIDVANYLVLETGVIAIEAWAFHYRATPLWSEAAAMSLAANAVTAVFGAYLMFFN